MIDDQIKSTDGCLDSGWGRGTTMVSNLAVTYAQEGKKVLNIDTDLRKPSLHQVFVLFDHADLSSVW